MRMKEIHSDADRRALLEKLRGQLSPEDEPRAMWRQAWWKRVAVLLAGPFMNVVLAIALFYTVALGWGLVNRDVQPIPTDRVAAVVGDTCAGADRCGVGVGPAGEAGILPGDRISFSTAARDGTVASYGTIEMVDQRKDSRPRLKVVAFSEPGLTHIVAKRLGASDTSDRDPATWIVPDWTDRIRNDPLGLAIVGLLGLGGAILSGIASIASLFPTAERCQESQAKRASTSPAVSAEDMGASVASYQDKS